MHIFHGMCSIEKDTNYEILLVINTIFANDEM